MNMNNRLFVLCAVLMLTACGNSPEETTEAPSVAANSVASPEPSPPAAEPASTTESVSLLSLDALTDCRAGQASTLRWTNELVKAGPVEIRIGEAADSPLFGRVGSAGSKETGNWVGPGKIFVARALDGSELARVVAEGPGCH